MPTPAKITRRILELVARDYGFTVDELRGPGRSRTLTLARSVAAFLLYDQQGLSQPEVGRVLNRDHSTISYELDVIREAILTSEGVLADHMLNLFRMACGVTL